MNVLACLLAIALSDETTAIRPIEEPSELSEETTESRPSEEPSEQHEPHMKVLPPEIALVLLGSYTLDSPLSTSETELAVSIVDDKVRLRIGETERLMIYERLGSETVDGVKSADVYGFTVVGLPGVQLQFKVLNNRVQYVVVFEEFAKPEVMTTARPKKR